MKHFVVINRHKTFQRETLESKSQNMISIFDTFGDAKKYVDDLVDGQLSLSSSNSLIERYGRKCESQFEKVKILDNEWYFQGSPILYGVKTQEVVENRKEFVVTDRFIFEVEDNPTI